MTWKSYAAVSGATVLACWLASAPPSNTPAATATLSRQAPQSVSPVASDIERQAERLQVRVRAERAYAEPERNPFRFASRRPAGDPAGEVAASVPPPAPVETAPAAPAVSLSGVAEDRSGDRTERTAILTSPAGLLFAREGEEILGYYRVVRIESEAVELAAVGTGVTRRLTLGARP